MICCGIQISQFIMGRGHHSSLCEMPQYLRGRKNKLFYDTYIHCWPFWQAKNLWPYAITNHVQPPAARDL